MEGGELFFQSVEDESLPRPRKINMYSSRENIKTRPKYKQ